jgi:glyoxylase-like metal-dependent hydrolase (beta-lactamase superfamily II)
MRLYAFHAGGEKGMRSLFDPNDPNCGAPLEVPYFFFLIQHAGENVLFDTGAHPATISDAAAHFGGSTGEWSLEVHPGDDAVSRLATVGVTPLDVRHIVQSHLHYDHAGGLCLFPDAAVHLNRAELPFALWPPVYQRDPPAYLRHEYEDVRTWNLIEGEHDILGDGRLIAFPTPGHTAGHQSLLVHLDSGAVVLTADAVYDLDTMRRRRLPSVLWSPDAMVASWERLEGLERSIGAKLMVTHDPEYRTRRRLAPDAWYE